MKTFKIVLSNQRNNQAVLDALAALGYTTNQELAMSNDYIYTLQDGTYTFTDSPLTELNHFPEYSLQELHELIEKNGSDTSDNINYRIAVTMHLSGKEIVCKLQGEESWFSINRYSLLELETGKFQFKII